MGLGVKSMPECLDGSSNLYPTFSGVDYITTECLPWVILEGYTIRHPKFLILRSTTIAEQSQALWKTSSGTMMPMG